MATYTVYLERLEVVRRAAQVRHVVHSAMEPLARRAGRGLAKWTKVIERRLAPGE